MQNQKHTQSAQEHMHVISNDQHQLDHHRAHLRLQEQEKNTGTPALAFQHPPVWDKDRTDYFPASSDHAHPHEFAHAQTHGEAMPVTMERSTAALNSTAETSASGPASLDSLCSMGEANKKKPTQKKLRKSGQLGSPERTYRGISPAHEPGTPKLLLSPASSNSPSSTDRIPSITVKRAGGGSDCLISMRTLEDRQLEQIAIADIEAERARKNMENTEELLRKSKEMFQTDLDLTLNTTLKKKKIQLKKPTSPSNTTPTVKRNGKSPKALAGRTGSTTGTKAKKNQVKSLQRCKVSGCLETCVSEGVYCRAHADPVNVMSNPNMRRGLSQSMI